MTEPTVTHTGGSLAGTVHLPVFGAVKKKTAVYGTAGVVGFVVVVYYVRQHRAASSSAADTSGQAAPLGSGDLYPPDGTTGDPSDPYSTDPATGMTYGDEAGTIGSGFGDAGVGSMPFSGGSNTDTSGGLDTSTTAGPPFNSNSQWAQYVEAAMGSTGSDAIAAAIGHYLAGSELTDAERTIAQEANAIGNPPPIAGLGGFPPSFRTKGVAGHPVTAHNPVTGLHVTPRTTQADVAWNAEANAPHYLVKILGGGKVIEQATVSTPRHTFKNLKSGHHYTAQVRAQPGGSGGTDARSNFTTK